jgi:glycogen(starch) synthase
MNLLVISNLYPPQYLGGFELITFDIVEGLRARGHNVTVLTGKYGVEVECPEDQIWRWLPNPLSPPPPLGFNLIRIQWQTKRMTERAIKRSQPDLILVTGLVGISSIILELLKNIKVPHVYMIADEVLLDMPIRDSWYHSLNDFSPNLLKANIKSFGRLLISLTGMPVQPQPHGVGYIFASQFLADVYRKGGIAGSIMEVIYPLIPGILGGPPSKDYFQHKPLRLLFAGRICREKGVDLIIQAMNYLQQQGFDPLPNLTIAGQRLNDLYDSDLMKLIIEFGLGEKISFIGLVSRSQLLNIYFDHDVLIFPTRVNEPFGMVPLEAMAAGLPVISTATGGAKEYLKDGENALVFMVDDVIQLAKHIQALSVDEVLNRKLINEGVKTASNFTDRISWLDRMESFLYKAESYKTEDD